MSTSGASFLIELSSATATKTGAPREARYQLQLNPGINIPYLAEPKAQLEALTFANVFTNIDQDFYKNAKLKVTWNPYVNTESGASVSAPMHGQEVRGEEVESSECPGQAVRRDIAPGDPKPRSLIGSARVAGAIPPRRPSAPLRYTNASASQHNPSRPQAQTVPPLPNPYLRLQFLIPTLPPLGVRG